VNLAVRVEMALRRSSCRFALGAFSSTRACFTLDISPFKRFWSCTKVAMVCVLEIEADPGTGPKDV